ncbi:hypothetical protein BASA60_002210 [Batrachochytrium salamandrivorans]|nr:hypothetical protein BASA60_002210 [Batrachochytrium salamandrivorans]
MSKPDKINALKDFIKELEERRKGKTSAKRTSINATIAIFEEELRELEEEFERLQEERQPQANEYRELKKALYENNFKYIRDKYLSKQ